MVGKKQAKVAKPSKPAKNAKKPPPPNTDSERSDSEDEASTSASAQGGTAHPAVNVAPNPFAMLDEEDLAAQEDAWEEVGKKKKKPEKSESAARPSPPPQPTVSRTILPPSVASVTSALSTARMKAAAATMASARTPAAARPAAASASPSPVPQDVPPALRPPRQATHDAQGRPISNDYYRAFQKLTLDRASGDVTLRFHKTDIVKVRGNGDVVLSCGGYYTRTTMMSMNDTLRYINMRVMAPRMDVNSGEWVVEDAYGKYAYSDNMVIKAQTPADRSRAMGVYRAYHSMDGDEAPGVAPAPKAAAAAPVVRPAGPPVPPPAPAPGEAPSLAYRLALSNYQSEQKAWQQKQAREALKQDEGEAANGGSSGAGDANAGDVYVNTDPSVTMKSANLSAEDYEQWAGDGVTSSSAAAAAAASVAAAATAASRGDGGAAEHSGSESGAGDDESLCVVCMERERGTVLVPCGHMVLCPQCCENIMQSSKECPLCRQPVSMHVSI